VRRRSHRLRPRDIAWHPRHPPDPQELQGLQGAIQQLQISRNKLHNSKEALTRLGNTDEGAPPPPGSRLEAAARAAPSRRDRPPGWPTAPARPRAAAGTPMLVPITSSLYVPGETAPLDSVLVDVGTGYWIEKSVDEAHAFLQRKMGLIEQQAQNVQHAAQFKQRNLQQTVDVMNRKVMEMRAAAAGAS
jgi:prefoldin subunit 5